MSTETKTWHAFREGRKIRIVGYRSFPEIRPKCWFRRLAGADLPENMIAFEFGFEKPHQKNAADAFANVEHLELDVPHEITEVKITDETGQHFLVLVEKHTPIAGSSILNR